MLGSGSIFYYPFVENIVAAVSVNMSDGAKAILAAWTEPWLIMILAPGAFFGLAIMMAVKKTIDKKFASNTK